MPEMSPEQSPQDREAMYLQNAQETMRQAAEPVVAELGELAVKDAEALAAADAQAPRIADEAVSHMQAHGTDGSVTGEAERLLAMNNAFTAVKNNADQLKHVTYKDKF